MSSFTKPLRIEDVDGRNFRLLESFIYYTNKKEFICVPEGFITDFASIPRLFWSIIGSPIGKYGKAAVVHDFCYHEQKYTRKYSDYIFLEAMTVLEVNPAKRWIMWLAVRSFGWIPWNKRAKELEKK